MQSIARPLILKQALLSLLIAVGLSLSISLIKFTVALDNMRHETVTEYSQLLALIEIPSEQAAYNGDKAFARQIVNGLVNKSLVYKAELVESNGSILASVQNYDNRSRWYGLLAQVFFPDVSYYAIALQYEPSSTFVGKLSIWVDQEELAQTFFGHVTSDLLIDLLKDIVLATLISLVFFVFVTRPLNKLTKVLQHHSEDISKPLPELNDVRFANNELGVLSSTFHQIWHKLEKTVKALERSDAYSKAIIAQAGDAIYISDIDGRIALCNKEASRMLGMTEAELMRSNLKRIHALDTWEPFYQILIQQPLESPLTVETLYRHASGKVIPIEIRLIKYILQEEAEVLILARDISARKEAENAINQLAYYDALTNLPNRNLIMDKLKATIADCREFGRKGALLLLDLDRFKNVNDSLGHDIGDQFLKELAKSLDALALGEIAVARLGGDEFVFVLPNLENVNKTLEDQAALFAKQVISVCRETQYVGAHELNMTASIGITFFDGVEQNVGVLLKQADTALYSAKDSGRHTYRFYKKEMQIAIDDRLRLEKSLHRAVLNKEFELFYQPQNTVDGKLIGAEVLIRWQDGENGFVPPSKFVPLAEEIGLIFTLGEWIIESAFIQLTKWLEKGQWHPSCTLSINVSPMQFQHPEFILVLERLLKRYSIPAHLIDLEVTENVLLGDLDSCRKKMMHIRSIGMKLSIDDFGTGYSSLQYLKNLPISRLKIDQSFVRDLLTDMDDESIVKAVIALAGALGIEVIAEGVESEALLARLKEIGCFQYQGYLFGHPIEADLFFDEHLSMLDEADPISRPSL